MTTITFELPEELAEERGGTASGGQRGRGDDSGDPSSACSKELLEAASKLAAAELPPLTLAEIQEEVDAVRSEKRRRATRARHRLRHATVDR
ncbi:MAG: hypothetical protein OXC31_01390 [Spirochaetaceae bacterium]|nr:hypothetical protein [Spirochaetaceae bacterium]